MATGQILTPPHCSVLRFSSDHRFEKYDSKEARNTTKKRQLSPYNFSLASQNSTRRPETARSLIAMPRRRVPQPLAAARQSDNSHISANYGDIYFYILFVTFSLSPLNTRRRVHFFYRLLEQAEPNLAGNPRPSE
jgi:hypothetical protein